MRIHEALETSEKFLSLEFFPPKELDKWPAFFATAEELKAVNPLFVSVTYGAGGSTQAYTLDIVARLKKDLGYEPMAHLTCVGADAVAISDFLSRLKKADIHNVLALRGDPPKAMTDFQPDNEAFQHGSDLTAFIRSKSPHLSIGVAGYPEKHPEAPSFEEDLRMLKLKVDSGGDFIVTQLFFDNDLYFNFVDKAREIGIESVIIPGVLPVLNVETVKRFTAFCGASLPPEYLARLEQANMDGGKEAVEELGVEYAANQVQDLLDRGAPGAHLYTLNRSKACLDIASRVRL